MNGQHYICGCCEWHGDEPEFAIPPVSSNTVECPEPMPLCPGCGERVRECHCDYTKADAAADAADMAYTSGE